MVLIHDELERRWQGVRRAMMDLQVDVVAVSPGDNMRYMLGYTPTVDERPSYLMMTAEGAGLVVPALNFEQAKNRVAEYGLDVRISKYSDGEDPTGTVRHVAESLVGLAQGGIVAVDAEMRADFLLILQAVLRPGQVQVASVVIGSMRMRKSSQELALLEHAARVGDGAMKAAMEILQQGVTEREIARTASDYFRQRGAEQILFTSIAVGTNTAYAHAHTSDRALQEGEPVTIDIGARTGGYCSDITRVAVLGTLPPGYEEVHTVVDEAVKAGLAAVKVGRPIADVDKAARGVIDKAGYGEYFVHRTGHGLGLTGHEDPSVHGDNQVLMREGMVFTVEPGIYIPGKFGVRLEEVVVVTPGGWRILSGLGREIERL